MFKSTEKCQSGARIWTIDLSAQVGAASSAPATVRRLAARLVNGQLVTLSTLLVSLDQQLLDFDFQCEFVKYVFFKVKSSSWF